MKEKNTLSTLLLLLLFSMLIVTTYQTVELTELTAVETSINLNQANATKVLTRSNTVLPPKIHKAAMGEFQFNLNPNPPNLELYEKHYSTMFDGDIQVNLLKTEWDTYGQTVWIKRKSGKVKAKYFAYKDMRSDRSVYSKYNSWKHSKEIVLVCSGAYTAERKGDSRMVPTGLTVDNGKIVNRNYRDDMDGLVIVYATGGIAVSDIEEGNLSLKSIEKKVDVKKSEDRTILISWAREEGATIFQTHLLAYRNTLRIDEKGRTERAERRMLALAIDKDGDVVHILFNIQEEVYLYDIARDILSYLQNKDMNVVAMLNLDTGWYNILEVYDSDGDKYNRLQGDKPLTKATNLVAYYYED